MAVMTAIGIGLAAFSAYQQYKGSKKQEKAAKAAGKAEQKIAESQGLVLDYNANVADLQAQDAIERGAEAESRFRAQIRGTIGAQRAGMAANNIDVSFGSAVDVQGDAAFLGELDALTIRTNAAREAWGFKVQATNYRKQAEIARQGGQNAVVAANATASAYSTQAYSSLIGGATSIMQQRYGWGSTKATLPSRNLTNGMPLVTAG